jgi:hypothetical protein
MPSTSITIPAADLPHVEASLDECPGIHLVGVDRFSRTYCDLHLDYTTTSDLELLGSCVARASEGEQPHG